MHGSSLILFEVWSPYGLCQGEVAVDPDVRLIVRGTQFRLDIAVSSPGLQVGVRFAERESAFSAFPESLCLDEDAGEYGVVEWFWRNPGECERCCAVEHGVIEAEDIDATEAGENPQIVVEFVEIVLNAAFVLVQDGSRDARVLSGDVACRCSPGEESPYGICFGSWLALRADGLSCFAEADIGEMHREFAALCAIEELCCRRNLMVCRGGVREDPVGFYEDVRHWSLG